MEVTKKKKKVQESEKIIEKYIIHFFLMLTSDML